MDKRFVQEFAAPPSQYRGAPFWAWNGKLEPEELRRQVRLMHRMGLGGFFMHSRVGLATAYLSDEWMRCVAACVDEAEKLDMRAWLYDEDRWPSGAAGGLVTRNPKHRMRALTLEVTRDAGAVRRARDVVAAFTARIDGGCASSVRPVTRGRVPPALAHGESLLIFRVELEPLNSWYNGYTYLDTLNPAAVREFIRVTHEAYRRRIGPQFGRRVPGIFTDEPNYGAMLGSRADGRLAVPWTDRLPAVFRARYGYDLRPHLPELFFDVDGAAVSAARYHYHDCVTHLFVDAFARQIGEWCGRNGLLFTGHVLAEDTLSSQTDWVGSSLRFYEHMQAPGMDLLTEHWRVYDAAKQVSSVARQFGRRWRLTETYGCTGWDFPFAGHKALGDWQVALGINLRCPHLSWYTMEGEAKRDYPAGIFYQSPWWELYGKVEDYFARLHAALTRGVEVRDVLVVHPIESMWTLCRKDWRSEPRVREYDALLMRLRDALLTQHIDFDYGDEDILARHARVSGGGDTTPVLRVGRATYKAVVVPPLITMRGTTLALLRRFRAAGGTVVFVGGAATHVDARPSPAPKKLADACTRVALRAEKLAATLEPVARRVSIRDGAGREIAPALYLLREDGDAQYLFVCNTGHTPRQLAADMNDPSMVRERRAAFPEVRIGVRTTAVGTPLELDPETGAMYSAVARRTRSGWEIRTDLPALGSRLFVLPKETGRGSAKLNFALPRRPRLRTVRAASLGGRTWDISLSEDNVLVLDRASFRVGGGRWQAPQEILRVDAAVRETLGLPRRGGEMVQPWARTASEPERRATVELRYRFDAAAAPSGALFLALERSASFRAALNGQTIDTDAECGWWCDRSLRKLPVDPACVRVGANELVLTCDFSAVHPGLEIVYLLGNFGTQVRGTEATLTAPPTRLRLGDWVRQGLAFYAGSVSYRRTIRPKLRGGQRLFVQVPHYRGVAVRVLVNGQPAGVIGWEPNEVEITGLVSGGSEGAGKGGGRDAAGPVELAIEVIGHRRNSHGPLHYFEKWPQWTGPGRFIAQGKEWQDEYQLVPCGLMAPPRLIVRR